MWHLAQLCGGRITCAPGPSILTGAFLESDAQLLWHRRASALRLNRRHQAGSRRQEPRKQVSSPNLCYTKRPPQGQTTHLLHSHQLAGVHTDAGVDLPVLPLACEQNTHCSQSPKRGHCKSRRCTVIFPRSGSRFTRPVIIHYCKTQNVSECSPMTEGNLWAVPYL